MSNRFKKSVIDNATSRNIDASLKDNLLDLFELATKSMATILVREAKCDTADFAPSKARRCEGFTFLIAEPAPIPATLGSAHFSEVTNAST